MRNPNLIDKLHTQLPAPLRRLLETLLDIAEQRNFPFFLVGGPLRDLLLDRPSVDLDIAVEGDAIALAQRLAETHHPRRDAPQARLGAGGGAYDMRVTTHPSFLTATISADGFHLDLITARSETYARPGALPTVKPATIREDLLRRDFTINALALRLNGPQRGEILDPAGGLADLDAKLIRALHDRSFQDDATRILRAFRYATRLEFEIEGQTLEWLKRDLRFLDTISGARIHHEFARILAEAEPEEALRALYDHGALAEIHPSLRFQRAHASAFARLRDLHETGARAAYWPVLAWRLDDADAGSLALRLALTEPQREALAAMPALEDLEPALAGSASRRDAPKARLGTATRAAGAVDLPTLPTARPEALEEPALGAAKGRAAATTSELPRSALAELLSRLPFPALWAFTALTDNSIVRDRLLDYLTKARHERPHLTGTDLLAMGVAPGPAVGDTLRRLRAAKLDGEVSTRKEELRLVIKQLACEAAEKTPLPARPEALEG